MRDAGRGMINMMCERERVLITCAGEGVLRG